MEEESMDMYSRVKLRGSTSKRKIGSKIIDSSSDSSPEGGRKYKPVSELYAATPRVMPGDGEARMVYRAAEAVTRTNDQTVVVERKRRGRKRADNSVSYEFEVGDLVWGKITSHPWWPGLIYNPACANEEALSTKNGDGYMAVFLYGDSTHGWIRPNRLLPFEEHFAAKSGKSEDEIHQRAVEEALEEVKRRSILGFVCSCHDNSGSGLSSFGLEEKLFRVDFGGFMGGGIYSGKQLKKAREAIQPEEMIGFLQRLAVNPRNIGAACSDMISLITITSQLQFYRKQRNVHNDLNEQDDDNDSLASWEAEAEEQAGEPLPDFGWGSPLPKRRRQRRLPKKPKLPTPKEEAAEKIISTNELQFAVIGGTATELLNAATGGSASELQRGLPEKPKAPTPKEKEVEEISPTNELQFPIIGSSTNELQSAATGGSASKLQRGRGRPKKPKAPTPKEEAAEKMISTNELQYAVIGGSASELQSATTGGSASELQRGLQEKPKAPTPKENAVKEISPTNELQFAIIGGSTNELQSAATGGSASKLKRGRGRPKKPKTPKEKAAEEIIPTNELQLAIISGPTNELQRAATGGSASELQRRLPKKPKAPTPKEKAVGEISPSNELQFPIIGGSTNELQSAAAGGSLSELQPRLSLKSKSPTPKEKAVEEIRSTNEPQFAIIGGPTNELRSAATGGFSSELQRQLRRKPKAPTPKERAAEEMSSTNELQFAMIGGSTNKLQSTATSGSSSELQRRLREKPKPPTPKEEAVKENSTNELQFSVAGGSASELQGAVAGGSRSPERAVEELPGEESENRRKSEASDGRREPGRKQRLLELMEWCNEIKEKLDNL